MVLQLNSPNFPLDAEALVALARAEKRLDYDLGAIDPSSQSTEAFLLDMAEFRSRSYLGFKFTCSVPVGVTEKAATLLGRAGVVSATLPSHPDKPDADHAPSYLSLLETVRMLHEAAVNVVWKVIWSDAMLLPDFGGEIFRTFEAATNLPAPTVEADPAANESCSMLQRLTVSAKRWESHFRPSTLTFARGPGFLRIRDRRASRGGCRFYTLKAKQAEILLFCVQIRSRSDIAELSSDVPPERVSAFLDRMVGDELMARHKDHYLSLPTRRTLGERWSSEVV